MSNFNDTPVMVELSTGASLPLRPAVAKKTGNPYHTILKGNKPAGRYGVKVDPAVVGGALPTSIKAFGKTIAKKDGVTQSGNTKVSFTETVETPAGPRILSISISMLDNGKAYNVLGSLHRPGGAGGAKALASL